MNIKEKAYINHADQKPSSTNVTIRNSIYQHLQNQDIKSGLRVRPPGSRPSLGSPEFPHLGGQAKASFPFNSHARPRSHLHSVNSDPAGCGKYLHSTFHGRWPWIKRSAHLPNLRNWSPRGLSKAFTTPYKGAVIDGSAERGSIGSKLLGDAE